MKKWVWHIGFAAVVGITAACIGGCNTNTAGSSFETENSVAVVVLEGSGSPAARTKVYVRPSDFLAGANSFALSEDSSASASPVVVADSAVGILNMETDDQGQLDLPKLKPGNYTIEARQETAKAFVRITVSDSSFESDTLVVTKTGSLSGQVYLPENVSSVKVGIQGLDYFVETDSLGNFLFENLPAGDFSVVGFVYDTYEIADADGSVTTYNSFLPVGSRAVNVKSSSASKNVMIGQKPVVEPDTVAKDTSAKDTVSEDSVDVYPVVLFEDFEDSTYGWYTTVSKYAKAKLDADEAGEGRKGIVAHMVYTNDSNYNWVLMGKSLRGITDLTELDSVVFWARGSQDSAQWVSFSFDVLMDSVDLEKYGYENGKAWMNMNVNTEWARYVVVPDSLIKADSTRNGGNIGWDKVKDHVTNLNIFGGGVGGPFEIWVDDITIYGVKDVD